eukprot:CAMPEP_0184647372 /NCGR_PEP_ID=MMETSP0308-20130426/4285_1 /TAXON_ID=38269 /ORGANISM="Gloeochaete witrockiana, Strain SAG 46.84" /LENGTH=94 /DNA_ID=CAMNT_0027078263 /DNA_START=27 /DNA_END=307 /DNA_ORIENTATION=+
MNSLSWKNATGEQKKTLIDDFVNGCNVADDSDDKRHLIRYRLRKGLETGELDLSEFGSDLIFRQSELLAGLTSLNLGYNQITSLPDSFGSLSAL